MRQSEKSNNRTSLKSLRHIGNDFVGKEYLLDTDPSAEIPFLDEIQGETFSSAKF